MTLLDDCENVAELEKQIDLLQNAKDAYDRLFAANAMIVEQSQIIAGLVLEHGGRISAANWDLVHAPQKFLPYSKTASASGDAVEVTLSEIEE